MKSSSIQDDNAQSPEFIATENDIKSFYKQFSDTLDAIIIPKDYTPPPPPPIPDTSILTLQPITRKRPYTAPPPPPKLAILPSERLRRAASAHKRDYGIFYKLDTKSTLNSDLLKRLNTPKNPLQSQIYPLSTADTASDCSEISPVFSFEAPCQTSWRTYSRPQSAVLSAIAVSNASSNKNSKRRSVNNTSSSRPASSRPALITPSQNTRHETHPLDRDPLTTNPKAPPSLETPPPIHIRRPIDTPSHHTSFPLEWFDDLSYESRSAQEWIDLGPSMGRPHTLAFSRFYSYPETSQALDWEWLPCSVLSFSQSSQSYLVQWHTNSQQKFVKRLNLIFEVEDRDLFYRRLERAIKRRDIADSRRAYNRRVEVDIDDCRIGDMPDHLRHGVLERLGNITGKSQLSIVTACMAEMNNDYVASMKQSVYNQQNLCGSVASRLHDDDESTLASDRFATAALAKSGAGGAADQLGELHGKVAVGARHLATSLFSANARYQRTIVQVLAILPDMFPVGDPDTGFFQKKAVAAAAPPPPDFAAFCERMRGSAEVVQARLTIEWPRAVSSLITANLESLFNFAEPNARVFGASRCADFLQLIGLVMSSQLRGMVVRGVIAFCGIFCIDVVPVEARKVVLGVCGPPLGSRRAAHSVDHKYQVLSPAPSKVPLLFTLRVSINQSTGQADTIPSLADVEQHVKSLLLLPISMTTGGVPAMEVLQMTRLFSNPSEFRYIRTLEITDPLLTDAHHAILTTLRSRYTQVHQILASYTDFAALLPTHPLDQEQYDDMNADIEIYVSALTLYNAHLSKIKYAGTAADLTECAPFVIDCTRLKHQLLRDVGSRLGVVETKLVHLMGLAARCLEDACEEIFQRILIDPGSDAGDWADLERAIGVCRDECADFSGQISDINSMWNLVQKFSITIDDNTSNSYWRAYAWPAKIENELDRATQRLESSKEQIRLQLNVDRRHCESCILAYEEEIQAYVRIDNLDNSLAIVSQVRVLRERIDRVFKLTQSINSRECLIGDPKFEVKRSRQLEASFDIYESLWGCADDMASTIDKWLTSFFMDLNAEEMLDKMDTWRMFVFRVLFNLNQSTFLKLAAKLTDAANLKNLLCELQKRLDTFSRYTNILIALLNPALRDKHWSQISNLVGISLSDVQNLKLRDIMELDLEIVQDIVGDISSDASNDLKLETSLENLKLELSATEFGIETYNSKYSTVTNINEAVLLLEDHLIVCESLVSRASASNLILRIESWSKKLFKAQEFLDLWSNIQDNFGLLNPLFEIPELCCEFTREDIEEFNVVSKAVVILGDVAMKNRRFMIAVLKIDLFDMILNANQRAERLLVMANQLVQKIRDKCHRFYYLTVKEISEILRIIPHARKINPYLSKMFDNVLDIATQVSVARIVPVAPTGRQIDRFGGMRPNLSRRISSRISTIYRKEIKTGKSLEEAVSEDLANANFGLIYSVGSYEAEYVVLSSPVIVTSRVDQWIVELDSQIKATLWINIIDVFKRPGAFDVVPLIGVIPFQICYMAQCLVLTRQFDSYVDDPKEHTARDIIRHLQKILDTLISRTLKGTLAIAARSGCETIILLLSFYLGLIERFSECTNKSINRVEWVKTPRYYLEEKKIIVKMSHHCIPYDFEYCGARPRLLLSCESLKYFDFAMSSMHQHSSPAFLSPDISLKRGTLVELSMCFGKKLVIIECHQANQASHITSLVCGALSLGSFIFFENIERMKNELLSIVAQIVHTIQRGKLFAIKSRSTQFQFDSKSFSTNIFSACFLGTDNHHWNRLPRSIRNVFRPIGINMPDISALGELIFIRKGFPNGKMFGRKLQVFCKTVLPMISNSTHYNFEFRLILIIFDCSLSALKPSAPNFDSSLIFECLESRVFPMAHPSDLPYMRAIAADIFGCYQYASATNDTELKNGAIHESIRQSVKSLHLPGNESFVSKAAEVIQIMKCSPCIVLCGPTMSGKSTILKVIFETINSESRPGSPLLLVKICAPEAVTFNSLLGESIDGRWRDGILTDDLRQLATHSCLKEIQRAESCSPFKGIYSCALLDGSVDNMILDRIYCTSDKRFSFSLDSGETLEMPLSSKLLVETDSISSWSPSNASKFHIMHVSETLVSIDNFIINCLQSLPEALRSHLKYLTAMFELFATPCIEFAETMTSNIITSNKAHINNICLLMRALYTEFGDEGYQRLMKFEQLHWMLANFVFSLIWVIGSYSSSRERISFDQFIKQLLLDKVPKLEKAMDFELGLLQLAVIFPDVCTVYEYYFDCKLLCWKRWYKRLADEIIDPLAHLIATDDLIRIPFLTSLAFSLNLPVLIHGDTEGSGKTTCLQHAFDTFQGGKVTQVFLNITNYTGPYDYSTLISQKLQQKRKRTIGLPPGNVLLAFVDDLTSNSLKNCSAMLETWRLYFETRSSYVNEMLTNVENIQLGAIIRTASGYRPSEKDGRCFRHFMVFSISCDEEAKVKEISQGWFKGKFSSLSGPYADVFPEVLINMTWDVYNWCRATFVKTPVNPHYIYSMRDVLLVIRQNLRFVIGGDNSTIHLLQVWLYDCLHIFGDRLTDEVEVSKLETCIEQVLRRHLDMEVNEVVGTLDRPLLSASYGRPIEAVSDRFTGERKSQSIFKAFLTNLELVKRAWSTGEKAVINYEQIKDVGHFDGLLLSAKIHHSLYSSGCAILAGINYHDQALITRMTCAASNMSYLELKSFKKVFDQLTQWNEFLRLVFTTALEAGRPIVVFARVSELTSPFQWRDVTSILKWGWIHHSEEIVRFDEVTDATKVKLKEMGFDCKGDSERLFRYVADKRLVRFVLCNDDRSSSPFALWKILSDIPAIRSIPIIWIRKWTSETISHFALLVARQHATLWLSAFLSFVITMMGSLPAMERGVSGTIVQYDQNAFKTAIAIYVEMSLTKTNELDAKLNGYTKAILVTDKIVANILILEREFNSTFTHLEETNAKTQVYFKELEYERENRDRIAIEIQIQSEACRRTSNEFRLLEEQYASEIERVLPALNAAAKNVDLLKKTDIYEIKAMINPPRGALLVMECLLHIFKVDMKGSDGVWELAKRLLVETKFVYNITNFDKESLTTPMMHRVEQITSHGEFGEANLVTVSRAIGSIVSWIKSLQYYHRSVSSFEPKRRHISDLRSKNKFFQNEVERNEKKLRLSEESLSHMKLNFDTLIKDKESVSKKHIDCQSKYASSQILLNNLKNCKTRWLKAVEDLTAKKLLVVADSFLVSCSTAFLGPYSKSVRTFARKEMEQWLKTNEVQHSLYENIFDFYTTPNEIFLTNDITPDLNNLDNAVMARLTNEVPLLCESHQVVRNLLMVMERAKNPLHTSTLSPKWMDNVFELMKSDGVVLLDVFSNEPNDFLVDFLRTQKLCRSNKQKCIIEYNGELIEVHRSFKLYLIINRPLHLVSAAWQSYTAPISVTLDQEIVCDILLDISLSGYAGSLRELRKLYDIDTMNRIHRQEALEKRGLEFAVELKPENIMGGELYRDIIDNEKQLNSTAELIVAARRLDRDLQSQLTFYTRLCTFGSKIFMILEKMSKVTIYHTSLSSFMPIFKKTLQEVEGDKSMKTICKCFLRNIHNYYSTSFATSDRIYMTFMIAAEYARSFDPANEFLKIPETHWHFFINGEIHPSIQMPNKWMFDEFPSNPAPSYLKKSVWEKITLLAKLPEFSRFAMEFVAYANKTTTAPTDACWEDVFQSVDPSSAQFPDRWDAGLSLFEKTLVLQCLRPDSMAKCFENYISMSIGPEFLEPMYNYLPTNTKSTLPIPTMIFTTSSNDIIEDLRRIALQKRVSNFLSLVTIGEGENSHIMEVIEDSIQKGRWLIIQDCQKDIAFMHQIDEKVRALGKAISSPVTPGLININFRLWLISKPCSSFPISMYSNCNRLFSSHPRNVKNMIAKLQPILEDNLTPHEFNSSPLYRSLLLKMFLFFITLSQRRIYYPFSSVINDCEFFEADLDTAIKHLRQLFRDYGHLDSIDAEFLKNLWGILGEVSFGAHASDNLDTRLLSTLFSDTISLDWASESRLVKSFRKILECMNKNEMRQCSEYLSATLPSSFDPDVYSLNINSTLAPDRQISLGIFKCVEYYNVHLILQSPRSLEINWTLIEVATRDHIDKILLTIKGGLLDPSQPLAVHAEISAARHRHVDALLHDNICRYRRIISLILPSLERLLACLQFGTEDFDEDFLQLSNDIHNDELPVFWKDSGLLFKCRLGFRQWMDNLLSRLHFIKEWASARYGLHNALNKGLVTYDISCLFHPAQFFNEFETMILPQKQNSPADRGYYLTGLTLHGAAWDYSKNSMKEVKNHEMVTPLVTVWIQPILRQEESSIMKNSSTIGAKQQQGIKKTLQKYRCPIFLYRPKNKEIVSMIGHDYGDKCDDNLDWNTSLESSTSSMLVGSLDLSSDTAQRYWIRRNVMLVLENN